MSEDPSGTPPFSSRRDESAEAAARWLARRDRGLTPAEAAEFALWRKATAEHAEEFAKVEHAWSSADLLAFDPGLAALAAEVDADSRRAMRQRERRRTWAWSGGLAAAAAVTLLTWVNWPAPTPTPLAPAVAMAIEVVPSQAHRVALADGSAAELRGDSEVKSLYTPAERRVRLTRGEAHFVVQKDASRPFIVEAGGLAVRAVGTAFNVRLDSAGVEVTVTEGKISLHETAAGPVNAASAPTLVAGQRMVVETTPTGGIALARASTEDLSSLAIDQSLAWQGTRLVLNRATLADTVAVFNQHSSRRVEIDDDALKSRLLSGSFAANNADALVRLLEQAAEVKVERRADGVVVLHAAR